MVIVILSMNYLEVRERAKSITTEEYIQTIAEQMLNSKDFQIVKIAKAENYPTQYDVHLSVKLYKTESVAIHGLLAGWYGANLDNVHIFRSSYNVTYYIEKQIRQDITTLRFNVMRINRRKRKQIIA